MIVKYFHYHVGSYVSKNTRGGDTIRLLIKLIVMKNLCSKYIHQNLLDGFGSAELIEQTLLTRIDQ